VVKRIGGVNAASIRLTQTTTAGSLTRPCSSHEFKSVSVGQAAFALRPKVISARACPTNGHWVTFAVRAAPLAGTASFRHPNHRRVGNAAQRRRRYRRTGTGCKTKRESYTDKGSPNHTVLLILLELSPRRFTENVSANHRDVYIRLARRTNQQPSYAPEWPRNRSVVAVGALRHQAWIAPPTGCQAAA
jgi:hypothetical protein